ncbi:hypothetical protein C2E23DRAFT_871291 [Lenzites betulinus]|nr:hypothetical protein C2E23DRAFT_871291 [Lenzites betulinus]
MIKSASAFKVALSPLLPDDSLKLAVPIWYHIGAKDGRSTANSPANRCLRSRHDVLTVGDCVAVAARLNCNPDGGPPHTLNATSGAGVWYGDNDPRNRAVRVPGGLVTNQRAELYAVAVAVAACPPFARLNIVSDSRYVVDGLTRHIQSWEDRRWTGVAHADLLCDVLARLRARSAPTTFKWVKGHSGVPGNEGADRLANAGAAKDLPADLGLPVPPRGYVATGIRLPVLTQRLAYKAIRCRTAPEPRRRTARMMGQVVAALVEWGCCPTEAAVWKAILKPEFRRGIRDFWWKALHGSHRVGAYWENIPEYEVRAVCPVCGVLDSLDHILLECDAPGQGEVWGEARALLQRGGIQLPQLSLGMVLGAPAYQLPAKRPGTPPAGQRLARIVITESAYLIWRLRNQRVIGGPGGEPTLPSRAAVKTMWLAVINKRFLMDRLLTAPRLGKSAVCKRTVLATWDAVVADRADFPDDWTKCAGVLVGKPAPVAGGVG